MESLTFATLKVLRRLGFLLLLPIPIQSRPAKKAGRKELILFRVCVCVCFRPSEGLLCVRVWLRACLRPSEACLRRLKWREGRGGVVGRSGFFSAIYDWFFFSSKRLTNPQSPFFGSWEGNDYSFSVNKWEIVVLVLLPVSTH